MGGKGITYEIAFKVTSGLIEAGDIDPETMEVTPELVRQLKRAILEMIGREQDDGLTHFLVRQGMEDAIARGDEAAKEPRPDSRAEQGHV